MTGLALEDGAFRGLFTAIYQNGYDLIIKDKDKILNYIK